MSGFFSEEENQRQSRARRTSKTQQLFSTRSQDASEPYEEDDFSRQESHPYASDARPQFPPNDLHEAQEQFIPNEPFFSGGRSASWENAYTSNEPGNPASSVSGSAVIAGAPYPENEDGPYLPNDERPLSAAYYRRPVEEDDLHGDGAAPREEMAFAPPPRFSMPTFSVDEAGKPPEVSSHVYQPKAATWSATERRESLTLRQAAYRVEAEKDAPPEKRDKKRGFKALGIVACVLVVLGTAAYFGRDWIGQQVALLSGEESTTVAGQADLAVSQSQTKGYDPAPAAKLNEKAQKNIAAVSGTMDMETYAITSSHVVTRVKTGENQYDVYLFSAKDGVLLGYYEGVSEAGFAPQPNENFYVEQSPYLLGREGKALLSVSRYAQYVGEYPVLTPFENGWAIISDAEGKGFNYVNQEGKLLSTLWFARALPFYGDYTAAYVDTGNLGKPESRYALYVLSADGEMERWQYAGDMQGLLGAAGNLALMETGELVSLKDTDQTICITDSARVYLDCEAMVVRDQETGKYGLFVKGEQHYDFVYDSIAPVACEIQWKQIKEQGFTLCAVAEATYPQPLSHYFTLQRDGAEELVALSTRSVYPIILK